MTYPGKNMAAMNPYCWLSMASCVFIVNAANAILFRSTAATMKRMKTNGSIRLRTLRVVRASTPAVMVLNPCAERRLTQQWLRESPRTIVSGTRATGLKINVTEADGGLADARPETGDRHG